MGETVISLREKVTRQLDVLSKLMHEITMLTGENEAIGHILNFEGGGPVVIQAMSAAAKKEGE